MRDRRTGVVLLLRCGADHLELTLVPDPQRTRRALAHGGGFALAHANRQVQEPLRRALRALSSAITAIPAEDELGRVIDTMRGAVASLGATLERVRNVPPPQLYPRWPQSTLLGLTEWLPFDVELVSLTAGLRRLIKRDSLRADAIEHHRAWLEGRGLFVRLCPRVGEDGAILFASHDRALVDDAVLAEERHLDGDAAAERFLGAALGYPSCCVDGFVATGSHDDFTLASQRLEPIPAAPAPAELLWLIGPLALISHLPCTPRCAATLDLARVTLRAAEGVAPGREAIWRELGARVHAIDTAGVPWSLLVDGDLADGAVVRVADRCVLRGDDVPSFVRDPTKHGARTRIVDGALLVDDETFSYLVADHRG